MRGKKFAGSVEVIVYVALERVLRARTVEVILAADKGEIIDVRQCSF